MTRAVVIGDCLLDVSIEHGPIAASGDRPARIRASPGGQGANVAVRLARRGLATRLLSPWCGDLTGRLLREHLAVEGVELVPLGAERSGAVAVLLDPDGERTMLSDRPALDADALAIAVTEAHDADWVHLSGYALGDPAGELLAARLSTRDESVRLSVDGGSVTPEHAELFRERLTRCVADLLVVSRSEASVLAGTEPGEPHERLAARLERYASLVVVTAGSCGSAAACSSGPISVPAQVLAASAVDATGAGDAYSARLIAELAVGSWPPSAEQLRAAMQAASASGGEVAQRHGAQARVPGE